MLFLKIYIYYYLIFNYKIVGVGNIVNSANENLKKNKNKLRNKNKTKFISKTKNFNKNEKNLDLSNKIESELSLDLDDLFIFENFKVINLSFEEFLKIKYSD